jgi:hypothetical protein
MASSGKSSFPLTDVEAHFPDFCDSISGHTRRNGRQRRVFRSTVNDQPMMNHRSRTTPTWLRSSLFALAAAGLATGLWVFFNVAHEGHSHASHDTSALALNDGKRWATDAPLRAGMQRIRDAVNPVQVAIASGRVVPADVHAMSASIQENVNDMLANCKLPAKADATLHVFITDLLSGAAVLKANPASTEGLDRITGALRLYPKYFDHPGWNPLSVDAS